MKRFSKKGLFALLALLLLIAGSVLWIFFQNRRPDGHWGEITYQGETVQQVDLRKTGVFQLKADPSILYEVRDGGICFVQADCPDKICEQAGLLTRVGETAVCLPRQTVITVISGEEPEVDAVAG